MVKTLFIPDIERAAQLGLFSVECVIEHDETHRAQLTPERNTSLSGPYSSLLRDIRPLFGKKLFPKILCAHLFPVVDELAVSFQFGYKGNSQNSGKQFHIFSRGIPVVVKGSVIRLETSMKSPLHESLSQFILGSVFLSRSFLMPYGISNWNAKITIAPEDENKALAENISIFRVVKIPVYTFDLLASLVLNCSIINDQVAFESRSLDQRNESDPATAECFHWAFSNLVSLS